MFLQLAVLCGVLLRYSYQHGLGDESGHQGRQAKYVDLLYGTSGFHQCGGAEAVPNAFPWMVAIVMNGTFTCGGSLINDRYVLTAAHCFTGRYNNTYIKVVVGEHNRCTFGPHTVIFSIDKLVIHPRYHAIGYHSDIMLIRLNMKITFNKYVRPICLPNYGIPPIFSVAFMASTFDNTRRKPNWLPENPPIDALCSSNRFNSIPFKTSYFVTVYSKTVESRYAKRPATALGWGRLVYDKERREPHSCVLRRVDVPILSAGDCRRAYPLDNHTMVNGASRSSFCAGVPEGGRDACQGDSGGPLQLRNKINNRYYLIGIISNGFGCALAGSPGLYTDVPRFVTWIRKETSDAAYCW